MSHRKHEGLTQQERRHVDQDPLRVPPHKKPKRYRLSVEFETIKRVVMTKEFSSKADMQAFRVRVEAVFEKRKRDERTKRRSDYSLSNWRDEYELKMNCEESHSTKDGPLYTEELLTGQEATA